MSEALALNGNQLNYFTTYFNVGCESQDDQSRIRTNR
jgi:hypothetical protein